MDEEKFQGEMKNLLEGELLQPTVLTSEERQQKAQVERHEQLMRRLDDIEVQIGLRLQGMNSHLLERITQMAEQSNGTARWVKEIHDLIFRLIMGGFLVLVCYFLAKSFGEWVYSLLFVAYIFYMAYWWWRYIIRDPPPTTS